MSLPMAGVGIGWSLRSLPNPKPFCGFMAPSQGYIWIHPPHWAMSYGGQYFPSSAQTVASLPRGLIWIFRGLILAQVRQRVCVFVHCVSCTWAYYICIHCSYLTAGYPRNSQGCKGKCESCHPYPGGLIYNLCVSLVYFFLLLYGMIHSK